MTYRVRRGNLQERISPCGPVLVASAESRLPGELYQEGPKAWDQTIAQLLEVLLILCSHHALPVDRILGCDTILGPPVKL